MSYRNFERRESREESVEELRDMEESGKVMIYMEKEPVQMNRRKIYNRYNDLIYHLRMRDLQVESLSHLEGL